MRAPMIVRANPVANDAPCMLQRFESIPMHALLFQRADDPLDHPILLWIVRFDELLLDVK